MDRRADASPFIDGCRAKRGRITILIFGNSKKPEQAGNRDGGKKAMTIVHSHVMENTVLIAA
jgi:hypothetical protein